MGVLRRDFGPPELKKQFRPLGLDGCVAVQARQTLDETRRLLALSGEYDFIRGVVGWAPLAGPGLNSALDELGASPALKGLRHVVQDEPDPAFLDGAQFNSGLREVTRRGLTFDLLVFAEQLPAVIRVVDRHPGQAFVLDHIAKPRLSRTGPDPVWAALIQELALRPHVSCKLSGLVTEVTEPAWDASLLTPYADLVLEAFSPRRLMFGSDWPVCLLRSSYQRWWSFVAAWAAQLSADEQADLFGGAAVSFYHL